MFNFIKKIPNGQKFLLGVVLVYFVVGYFRQEITKKAFEESWTALQGVLPFLVLVFIIIFLVNLFVKPEMIKKHLGADVGWRKWLYVVIGSVIIVGPPYVLFPIFGELKKNGMKNSLIVAFFSNRNVQPVFIPVMIHYFGLAFTVVVSIYVLIFSLVNGYIAGKILDRK
ncbi:hypothetical protein L6270_00520 [Candidatus Parcubacteria bacterium]|nr:hypothetical protein [Patescibacteria group bacterium]MBU4309633.1 hypothetical protein [Patescibacteria group bacterium]MBU4432564.1 hypothetical protein [Patescibacteria group bacterium]MBU4577979.1 hypothetical protein [Patescibacteria group bacterium]MCG2696512.1 hypothetical protein [Candidatus Parcubacteria bacterium]